ncbi:Cytokinesis defective protein [Dirofilaria immitis]
MDDADQLDEECWKANMEIDYTQKSKRRHFRLEIGNVTFYVDPTEMSKKSRYFELLTTSNYFMEGIRGSSRLYEKNDEITSMLQSTCPTVYGIYPRIIRVQSIPALARLADKYNLKILQFTCEYFALRANFQKYGNNVLVKLLQTAIMYNYDPKLQENLIKELIIRSKFPCKLAADEMTKEICNIILKNSLKHNGKNMHGGICQSCGQQRTINFAAENRFPLWKCERCNLVYCLKCESIACIAEVNEQLRNAFGKYEMEELRNSLESMKIHE